VGRVRLTRSDRDSGNVLGAGRLAARRSLGRAGGALALSILVALVLPACQQSTGPSDAGSRDNATYNAYNATLPTWAEAVPLEEYREEQMGDAETFDEMFEGVTYNCSTERYSLAANPEKIVTLQPDVDALWVGSLLQGKGHIEGIGSLAELPIRERAPLTIYLNILANDVTRTLDNPTGAGVHQAVGELVLLAQNSGAPTDSSINFHERQTHSVEQAALNFGFSARYLSSSIKGSLQAERNASETTITASFVQEMFTASMVSPQTPGGFFSDAFDQADLQAQIDLGRIGPDNLPVYVSGVTYGRVLHFSFTSSATEEEIRATLNATYEAATSGGSVDLSAEQKKILSEAEIKVVAVGGEADHALAVIRSGKLRDYFTESAALSSAVPISYSVRNLGDGSNALVTETTEYSIKSCRPKPEDPAAAAIPRLGQQFYASGDLGQCNKSFYSRTGEFVDLGDWTREVFIDADGRNGGCFQSFAIQDPDGVLAGLKVWVNLDFEGDTNQCQNAGNRQVPITNGSGFPDWSDPYLIDTDNRAGGCYLIFTVEGSDDYALDVGYRYSGSDTGECSNDTTPVGTFTARTGQQAKIYINTRDGGGGCLLKLRLYKWESRFRLPGFGL
jgi:hypothetical protein